MTRVSAGAGIGVLVLVGLGLRGRLFTRVHIVSNALTRTATAKLPRSEKDLSGWDEMRAGVIARTASSPGSVGAAVAVTYAVLRELEHARDAG